MRSTLLSCFATVALWTTLPATGWATECADDSECPEGQICLLAPCAACDPGDETCDETCEPHGICEDAEGRFMQECVTDDDCEGGWICEVVGGVGCAEPVCPDGDECPEVPPCEPEEITACVPPPPEPCTSDADCEEGLICVTYEYSMCTGYGMPDCPPDVECPEPELPECEDVTESYCVPPYFAPCSEDADCGEGFSCVDGEICSCSGGGSTGSSGGGSTDPVPDEGGEDVGTSEPPDCSCEPSGEMYCELDEMPCSADADCPADFVCEQISVGSETCFVDEIGEVICEESDTPESEGYCLPANWETWMWGGDGGVADSREAFDETVSEGIGSDDAQAAGRAEDFAFPEVNDPGSSDSGACSSAPTRTSLPVLLLLGLVALVSMRRR